MASQTCLQLLGEWDLLNQEHGSDRAEGSAPGNEPSVDGEKEELTVVPAPLSSGTHGPQEGLNVAEHGNGDKTSGRPIILSC